MTMRVERIRDSSLLPGNFTFREEDERECRAGGLSPWQALRQSVDLSLEAYVMVYHGDVVCVWGYRPSTFMGETAHAWMLGTPLTKKYKFKLARESLRIIEYILEKYPKVQVTVHTEYDTAVEWLQWLGFDIVTTEGNFHTMVRER